MAFAIDSVPAIPRVCIASWMARSVCLLAVAAPTRSPLFDAIGGGLCLSSAARNASAPVVGVAGRRRAGQRVVARWFSALAICS